jgi:hypothetical protein
VSSFHCSPASHASTRDSIELKSALMSVWRGAAQIIARESDPTTSSGRPTARTRSSSPESTAAIAAAGSSGCARAKLCGWNPRPDQRPVAAPWNRMVSCSRPSLAMPSSVSSLLALARLPSCRSSSSRAMSASGSFDNTAATERLPML